MPNLVSYIQGCNHNKEDKWIWGVHWNYHWYVWKSLQQFFEVKCLEKHFNNNADVGYVKVYPNFFRSVYYCNLQQSKHIKSKQQSKHLTHIKRQQMPMYQTINLSHTWLFTISANIFLSSLLNFYLESLSDEVNSQEFIKLAVWRSI